MNFIYVNIYTSLSVYQDVDTIYLTQDTRELNLQDFSHLENRYLRLISFLIISVWGYQDSAITTLWTSSIPTVFGSHWNASVLRVDSFALQNVLSPKSCHYSCHHFVFIWIILLFCVGRDLVAIIAVLEFNQWFTKLTTKDFKLVSFPFCQMTDTLAYY